MIDLHSVSTIHDYLQHKTKCYSLYPKLIVLPPSLFGPKMIVQFISPAKNLRLKVKYFCAKLSSSRSLSTLQLHETFENIYNIKTRVKLINVTNLLYVVSFNEKLESN